MIRKWLFHKEMAIIITFKNIYSGVCVCVSGFKDRKNHRLIVHKYYSYRRWKSALVNQAQNSAKSRPAT